MKKLSAPVVFIIALFVLGACSRNVPPNLEVLNGETMGTTWQVKTVGALPVGKTVDEIQKEIEGRLKGLNQEMSTYISNSEISRFNEVGEGRSIPIGSEFRSVLTLAIDLADRTVGAFDPTLDPLINLWGFGHADAPRHAPSESIQAAAFARCGVEHLRLTGDGLAKAIPGLQLNLSAIAKGAAVDRLHEMLDAMAFEGVYVEIGGEVRCSGINARGLPWRIGVQIPVRDPNQANASVQVVELKDCSLATSGDYRNFREVDGEWVAHILDPRSGKPVGHRVASVSVLAENCATADALATALYVMGDVEGMEWVAEQPGVEVLFIVRQDDASFEQIASEGFTARLLGGGS